MKTKHNMLKYNVYLINSVTFKADKRLATYVSLEDAIRMESLSCADGYYIGSFLVKSDRDLQLRNDLMSKAQKVTA